MIGTDFVFVSGAETQRQDVTVIVCTSSNAKMEHSSLMDSYEDSYDLTAT